MFSHSLRSKAALAVASGAMLLTSVSAMAMTLKLFVDIEGHAYQDEIVEIQAKGIVEGYDDGTYKPDASINRAEFTKIIIEAQYEQASIDACTSAEVLSDIVSGIWYQQHVCVATNNDIIAGYGDGTFRGGNNINFAEATKIIVEAFDIPHQSDAAIWYRGYIEAMGRISALPQSYQKPDQMVTRGEMAFMISMALKDADKEVTGKTTTEVELTVHASTESGALYANYVDGVSASEQRLLFFHAPWCSYCKANHDRLTNLYKKSSASISTYRIDYDSSTDIKAQYGVVQQDTFVLVDAEGNVQQSVTRPDEATLVAMINGEVSAE